MAARALSIAELREQLEAKEKQLKELQARRNKLSSELEKVDAEIAGLTGGKATQTRQVRKQAPKAKAKRITAGRRGSLREAVGQVLAGTRKALGPKDIAEALPSVGYVSSAKNLATMVGQVLSGSDEFRRVSRGKYRLQRGRRAKKSAEKAQ
jgi:hypothetical protein